MVDGAWSWDGKGGRKKWMNQYSICWRAVFSVWSERAVERWQGERFEFLRRMGQIFVAILTGVYSKEAGQLIWLWSDWKIWVTRWQKGGVVLEWRRNGLNEVAGSWTADGCRRTVRIEVCVCVCVCHMWVKEIAQILQFHRHYSKVDAATALDRLTYR